MLIAVLMTVMVAGCSAKSSDAPLAVPTFSPTSTAPGVHAALPVEVMVPSRGIDGPIMPEGLGLDVNGGTAEPPLTQPKLASWYNPGPRPGDSGPSVILGHVNGSGKQGIFARLDEVKEQDLIMVRRQDGSVVSFRVYRTAQIDKAIFPASEVYGETPGPELRLITCGGVLDKIHHRYLSNIIVWARIVPG